METLNKVTDAIGIISTIICVHRFFSLFWEIRGVNLNEKTKLGFLQDELENVKIYGYAVYGLVVLYILLKIVQWLWK